MDWKLKLATLLALPLGGGCVVAYAEEPAPAYVQTMAPSDDNEVDSVVYREYFNCSDAEIALIPQYRARYQVSNDDLYFVFYTARRCNLAFDVCFRSFYYDCGRDYDRLVVHYGIPRESFFVSVGAGVACPPIYARPYAAYRGGYCATTRFSNAEYAALISMRVGCEYQGRSSESWFARVNSGCAPHQVIVDSRDDCGRGGHNVKGGIVHAPAVRNWQARRPETPHHAPAATPRAPEHRQDHAPAAKPDHRSDGVRGMQKNPPPAAAPARKPEAPRHVQSQPPQRRAPAPKSGGTPEGNQQHGRNDRN